MLWLRVLIEKKCVQTMIMIISSRFVGRRRMIGNERHFDYAKDAWANGCILSFFLKNY